jgi:rhodanese-related sulfurtransferase
MISEQEASTLKREAGAVFLDVRTPLEHGEVHVDGSRLEPLDRLDAGVVARELGGRKVVVVCRSGNRAKQAAAKLVAAGLGDVAVLDGGMMAWQAAGLPVVRGRKVMSLERQVRVGAGLMVVAGVVLGTWVHPAFYGLSAFVGAGLVFAGLTDWCGMGLLLARAPWNKVRADSPAAGADSTGPTCCAR